MGFLGPIMGFLGPIMHPLYAHERRNIFRDHSQAFPIIDVEERELTQKNSTA
jgi:hypothetical protein